MLRGVLGGGAPALSPLKMNVVWGLFFPPEDFFLKNGGPAALPDAIFDEKCPSLNQIQPDISCKQRPMKKPPKFLKNVDEKIVVTLIAPNSDEYLIFYTSSCILS